MQKVTPNMATLRGIGSVTTGTIGGGTVDAEQQAELCAAITGKIDFQPVTLADREKCEAFYKEFEPYSDFSFHNLWVWFNQRGNLSFAWHRGNLLVRYDDPFSPGETGYTMLGKGDCTQTVRDLFAWQYDRGLEPAITLVPQVVVDNLDQSAADIVGAEDINNRDYLYDVQRMHERQGGQYVKYRHALSYFTRMYSENVELRPLDAADPQQAQELKDCLKTWTAVFRQPEHEKVEGPVLRRVFEYVGDLPERCMGLYVDGSLQAFAFYHVSAQGNTIILNHLKCNNEYNYIFDFTISMLVEKWFHEGYLFFNMEQDLGLPGLRTHKERLRPIKYLTRYTLTPA